MTIVGQVYDVSPFVDRQMKQFDADQMIFGLGCAGSYTDKFVGQNTLVRTLEQCLYETWNNWSVVFIIICFSNFYKLNIFYYSFIANVEELRDRIVFYAWPNEKSEL